MVEKAIDAKVKVNLQPLSRTKEINSKCLKGYRLLVKKNKHDVNQKHQDGTPKDKVKSHNSSSANQPQTQAPRKDNCGSRQGGYLATRVNATEITKKDKDNTKDLNYIKCYTCNLKGHYANKCSKKSKN